MHRFKPFLQSTVRPLARWIHQRGGTANQVTLLALAGSVALGVLLALLGGWITLLWLLVPLWMLCRMALNAIDGLLARDHGHQSRLGAYFNELADVISDAAAILPLATVAGFWPSLVVGAALLASWTELAGALGPSVGASRRFEGPMGKADRAAVLGVVGLWIGWTGQAPPFTPVLQLVVLALLGITVLRRVGYGLSEAAGGRP